MREEIFIYHSGAPTKSSSSTISRSLSPTRDAQRDFEKVSSDASKCSESRNRQRIAAYG